MGTEGALIGIVDQDATSLRAVGEILTARGFRTLLLVEGSNPYQTILQERPDLVIFTARDTRENEWSLPRMLDYDHETAQIPLLICGTDVRETEKKSRSLTRHGRVSVLGVPFDPDTLTAKIRQMLSKAGTTDRL